MNFIEKAKEYVANSFSTNASTMLSAVGVMITDVSLSQLVYAFVFVVGSIYSLKITKEKHEIENKKSELDLEKMRIENETKRHELEVKKSGKATLND